MTGEAEGTKTRGAAETSSEAAHVPDPLHQMDRASVGTLRSIHMARTNCDHLQKVETSWLAVVVVAGSVGIKQRESMEKRESCIDAK